MSFALSRWKAFLIVLLVWAGVYLVGLGRQELLGQEGRRVLPAITMLETGNWVVPKMADREYYLKPPGINWLIALSFTLTGERSEFTARLPSVVFILIFVSLLIWLPIPWLSIEVRLISAIVFLTSIGIIDRGWLIEIEAVYVSLTGIATLLWLYIWSVKGSKWPLWIILSIVLGLGMLVKGPFILFFLYSVVISVLWYSGRLRDLFKIGHLAGLAFALLIAGGWFYLATQQISSPKTTMTNTMTWEFLKRIFIKPNFGKWAIDVTKSFAYFLPWLFFVPMLWDKKLISRMEQAHAAIFRGCRLGMVTGFAAMCLMPGMFARYVLPVYPMASILTGWVLSLDKNPNPLWKKALLACFLISCATATAGVIFATNKPAAGIVLALAICATVIVFWKRDTVQNTLRLSLVTAALCVVLMLQYATSGLDIITSKEMRKPAAMQINKIVPAGQTIYFFWHDYFYPAVFYLRPPVKYVHNADEISEQVHYMIVKKIDYDKLMAEGRISSRSPEVLYDFRIPSEYELVRLN
ncbi:MAG: glycosyltransferase family 39 protein [Sedimentisphaerales bacterium]|jgi:4-amino-4-deoxy-L-arabinose transferase-like glycosyltransferase